MHQSVCVTAPLIALLVLTCWVPRGQSCPRSCNCYQANEVHCTFRSLLNIPPGLPAHTRRINLGFNSINRLHDNSLAGLKRAELLMLHSNDLHHLPDGVFRDMKSLQILKLSYNKLREISSSLTFTGLTSLQRLYLDHNLLQYIHPRALLQLPSLRLLRLQGNRLHQLHPHTLCTLSLLNTYYFSTLRNLDLSNNSLTTLPKDTLAAAPLLETLVLQSNPWSCDCRMNWLLDWSLAHPGLLKCPGGPQCPLCATPSSLQAKGLLEQTSLLCTSPTNILPGKETIVETDLSEIQSSETFREPLGSATLGLSDEHGNNVDLSCNITHSSSSQDIAPPPDLSQPSILPLPLALSVSLECPVERQSYEKLWRILAYYSETAVRLEREIMLSKAPGLAYRYGQTTETDGYYHTGVKASVKARPHWLLQPAISIQLNRAESNAHKVHLIYSTRVSTHPDPASQLSTPSPASHPWVLILTNHTTTSVTAIAGSNVELSCPLVSSGNPKVQWILPDGSRLNSPSSTLDGRLQALASGLLLKKVLLSDAGIYYCVALAVRDVDVLPLRLAVEESSVPPSGEQVGPPIMGTTGELVKLSCKASGSPEPYLSWILPDGNVIRRGLAVSGGLSIDLNGSLVLSRPSLRDAGHYRCTAVNQYGSDSLSMQLILTSGHIPTLRSSFPTGPQSAAGRSTKIRAPLFHDLDEGSGDGEPQDETTFENRKHPVSLQPSPNRRYPVGNPRRRGPLRGSPTRGGGRPVSSTDQRRNRFENRQRIDPQKWADLLAKIRQKTNHSQPITTTAPTVEPVQGSEDKATKGHDEDYDTDEDRTHGASVGTESEDSSVDETVLQEEGLQPVQPVHAEIQPTTEPKTESEADAGMEESTEESTVIQIDKENETETPTGTTITGLQTKVPTNSATQKKAVISNPQSGANEIESPEEEAQTTNSNSSSSRPQTPQQGLPNLDPNSRPQSPWNSRRKIGQRRRIINRPRGRPLTPPQPPLDPVNPRSQAVTPDTTTSQLNMLSTATSPAILLTSSDHSGTSLNRAALGPESPSVSNSPRVSTSESSSSSPASSLSLTKTYTDMVTHSGKISDTEESTHFSTSAPTHSHNVISKTHVPDTHPGTFTHGIQTHTETQTASGKHVNRPQDEHSGDRKGNFSDVPHESHSSTTHSFTEFPSSTSTSKVVTTSTRYTDSTTHPGISSEDIHLKATSVIVNISNPTMFTAPANIIPTSSTTRHTATTPITATTHKTTTSVLKSTIPTTTTTTTTTNASSTTTTTTTTTNDTSTTIHTLRNSADDSTTTRMTTGWSDVPGIPNIPFITESTTTTTTILDKTLSATTTTAMPSTSRTTTTTTINTKAVSQERVRLGLADPKEKTDSGGPSQSRPPTDWKNPGANSIPDSHRSRSHWSPSSSRPVTPVASVARSRPKISDPHIRKVSFPAEGTARLSCEAQGEPKPSITWTKVTTGAVMSVHSRAERFEVLPNGMLVIRNIQQQDRGTYICSAQNFLGRDRLLTTLEVWTRPPRMTLPSNRESTIHQGGEVNLKCLAEGVPTPLLSWVLPNRSVIISSEASTNRISMDTNGTLHISVTLPSDRGVYRCVASNSAGAASASVRVHVSSLPPVIQQPREEHLLLSPGRPVYAHCSARGAPPPTLRWRIPDGTLVRPSQFLHGNLYVLPNGTLHIRKIGPKDMGSYECSASNAVGADKRTVKVEIKEDGEVKTEVAKTVATEKPSSSWSPNKDTNLNLPTHHSDPYSSTKLSPPSVHDRSRIFIPSTSHSSFHPHQPSSSNPSKINKPSTFSPTLFTNIKKTNPPSSFPSSPVPTNNTRVLPSTNNTGVTTSFSADRRIAAVLHPLPVSPFTKARIVSSSPSISVVHYGGTLQLHCSVNGNPAPIIIWRTPSRKLVDVHLSFDQRMKVHPNGTLSVQSVTDKDAGDYLCIARNKVSDDYRLLRVSVATKPAKIETKQPFDQMVSFGKPLKVDCQASGLPDPAVRWSLPDGSMVNSVLHGEDRGGRARRLTVFDNGTLLVPAVGLKEEGEYTCYAENQGGQDSMKVKVKVMMTSPPTFTDNRAYHVIKVHQGTTAKITCQATGDPPPTVTWFSPAHRIIPQSFGSGYYSERVVVVSGGTLEIRQAQKIDTGNYTCRASNTAGGRSMMVSLEVEGPTYGMSGQEGEHGRSINNGHGSNSNIDSRIINSVPNTGATSVISSSNPDLRTNGQHGFNRPVSGIATQPGSSIVSVGVSGGGSVGIKTDNIGATRNGAGIASSSNSVANSPSIVRGDGVERNPGTYNNEVIAGRGRIAVNTNTAQTWLSGISRNSGVSSSSVSNSRGGTSTHRGNGFSGSNNLGGTDENTRSRSGLISNTQNFTNTVLGVVTTVKLQTVKGQTVLLPCPSQGSPPPRLAWLLPGNGMLPAPYYGSRLTVHRNGSLELRGVRGSDAGTLVCVVKTEREEKTIRVELEVSEPKVEARSPHRGPNLEKPVLKTSGLTAIPQTGGLSDSSLSLNSRQLSPVVLQPKNTVTQKPLQRGSSFPALPPFKAPNAEPAVSTRTAPLVSIINGETLRLPCPASQTPGYSQGSLIWTMPSGKVLSRGESGDSGHYSVQEDGTLTVQQASVFDRGSYTCRSSSSDSSSASVITVPVIVIAYPPRITTGPAPVTYTRPGVAVELPCLTIATPRATVTWETPDLTQLRVMGQPRIYGNRYLSPQGSLVIQNPTGRDTGFYRCTAKNVIGVDTKATYLHVM